MRSLAGFTRRDAGPQYTALFHRTSHSMSEFLLENVPRAMPRDDLTAAQRAEMFELLTRHFDGVTRKQFESDLAEKNWVILLGAARA